MTAASPPEEADYKDFCRLRDYRKPGAEVPQYEPPVNLAGLAKSFNAGVHHSSAIHFKANVLASTLIPSKYLPRDAFKRMALDFLTFGNAYLEDRPSRSGKALAYQHALAKYMRRGVDLDTYYFVNGYQAVHQFDKGRVFHLMEPDVNQELYGVPQYLSALQSAWLNEAAKARAGRTG